MEILRYACDRNVPIELHYVNASVSSSRVEPDMLYAQTRMLGLDEQAIYLDSPQSIGKDVRLRVGRDVEAYFVVQNRIYTFRSQVTRLRCTVELNSVMKVVGMCLAMPNLIRSGQRREDHRISLASLPGPLTVDLHETSAEDPNLCPVDVRRFVGQAADLSRGGMAVIIANEDRFLLRHGRKYFLSFALPEDGREMTFLAELRHMRDIHKDSAKRLGFQFLRWPDVVQMREKSSALGKFLARMEREYLLRNKG